MNTRLTIGIITVIAILLGIFVFINITGGNVGSFLSPLFTKRGTLTLDTHKFTVFEAKTEKEKEIGLSERPTLRANEGMVFLFDKPDYYGFWMKNMKFPLDILYIQNKKIVTIFQNIPNPKSANDNLQVYTPSDPADMVLELNAGTVLRDHISVGDSVTTSL